MAQISNIDRFPFAAEVALSESVRPCGLAPPDEPVSIFLTGATGYLGAFTLHEFLTTTAADVYCLVRAGDDLQGHARIRSKMAAYGLWEDQFAMRIVPVIGDITKPALGLSPSAFGELSERCDLVVHGAANVNFLFPYRVLKPANVTAAVDVLRLACTGRQKRLHFVSTIGIFLSPELSGRLVREDDTLPTPPERSNGYAQSKWVAERIMKLARQRGVPVTVHRPGFIGWHSQTGVFNDKDFVSGMLTACLELGMAPNITMTLDVAPVDYVVAAMRWLAVRADSAGKTYHLNNPKPWTWSELVEAFREQGARIEWTSYESWKRELSRVKNPTVQRFATMLPDHPGDDRSIFRSLQDPPTFAFDTTDSDLAGSGLHCARLSADLVRAHLRHPTPGRGPARAESSTRLVRVVPEIKTGS